jgi:hypothetical protein
MSDAYQAWRETREHLKQEPDSTFLQRVEESLRPAALLAFLGSFRGMDTYEEPLGCEPEQAEEFLSQLDELRQPTYRPDETRAEMQRQVSKALTAMRKLPWTGDHLYGEALDDASLVLQHILAGKKGWPVLERFRCPSEYGSTARQNERVRCELQLPHESKHRARNTAGGEGFMWTDEQSVNPPKNYDEQGSLTCNAEHEGLVCTLPPQHAGQHFDARDQEYWGLKAGGRPPIELSGEQLDDLATEVFGDGECGAVNPDLEPNPLRTGKSICVRAKQHGGLHRDADGIRWEK